MNDVPRSLHVSEALVRLAAYTERHTHATPMAPEFVVVYVCMAQPGNMISLCAQWQEK